jgi:asparagine synthase (glutamine-hydrolysing)
VCGIAGEFIFRESGLVDADRIAPIANLLTHRGPDSWGYYIDPLQQAMLVHTRLAIVDPVRGQQPMCSEDGRIWISVNGEVYEFEQLAAELRARGHHLRSRCDSEVIVHLYEEYGEAAFERLRGEFAIALFDERNRRLVLARDRFGVKPLYYRVAADRVQFGSEIKAILCQPGPRPALDPQTLGSMIRTIIPPGATVFRGVRMVEPGCYLKVDEFGATQHAYCGLDLQARGASRAARLDERDAIREFRGLLTEAVRLRLQGDVEVGAYLSGGVDSSAIVAIMAGLSAHPVKTFTIGFENPAYDESEFAAGVARAVGAECHTLRLGRDALTPHFVRSLWHHELPVMNGHAAAKFLLSRLAGAHVKVILSGEGADELLLGYPQFKHQALIEDLRAAPASRDAQRAMKRFLRTESVQFGVIRTADYRDFARILRLFGTYPYPILRGTAAIAMRQAALAPPLRRLLEDEDPVELLADRLNRDEVRGLPPLRATQYLVFKTDLPSYILNVLGDRSEMAHSVEGRVPFLDQKLVDFAAGLPLDLLAREGCSKYLLRRAVADLLPAGLLARRKKIFLSPTPELLGLHGRNPEFERYFSRAVTEEVGIFNPVLLRMVRRVIRFLPRGSYAYGVCEALLVFALSVHILHELFCTSFAESCRRFAPAARMLESCPRALVTAPPPARSHALRTGSR